MPPKRSAKQTETKPKVKPAAATASASKHSVARKGIIKSNLKGKKTSLSITTADSSSRTRNGARVAQTKTAVRPQTKSLTARARPWTVQKSRVLRRDSKSREQEEEMSTSEDEPIGSKAMQTPVEISDVNDNDEDEDGDSDNSDADDDVILLHSSSALSTEAGGVVGENKHRQAEMAMPREPPVVAQPVSLPLDSKSSSTEAPCTTPSKALGETRLIDNQEQGDENADSKEESPEALTVDSQSKRSNHRSRHHLVNSATTATQPLHEEMRGNSQVAQRALLNENTQSALAMPTADEGAQETVKRLFTQSQCTISYSPISPRTRSLSSSSSSPFTSTEVTANRTLPMVDEEAYLPQHNNVHQATSAKPRLTDAPLGTDISRSFSSNSEFNVLHGPLSPGSPTADIPPPPLALSSIRTENVAHSPFTEKVEAEHTKEDGDSEFSPLADHSADLSLLGGSTRLSTAHTWSSSSAHVLQQQQPDQEGGNHVTANTKASRTNAAVKEHKASMQHRQDVCPSFQPEAERATLIDVNSIRTNSNSSNTTAVQNDQQRQQSDLSDMSSRPSTQQIHQTPVPSGHLRMGGGVSRARSPSTTPARLSHSWLKKVNVGVEVAPSSVNIKATRSQTNSRPSFLVSLPATVSVFPTHPLTTQQQQQYQGHLPPQHRSSYSQTLYVTHPTVRPEAVMTLAADHDGAKSDTNSRTSSSSGSPLRLRQREPPAWRSPQPSQFPKSLNVSPSSVQPFAASYCTNDNNSNFGNKVQMKREDGAPLSFPVNTQTKGLPGTTPALASPELSTTSTNSYHEQRSPSNSSTSTAVLTRAFTQSPVGALHNAEAEARAATSAQPSNAASAAEPSFACAAGSPGGQIVVTSRLSTQLITKAAATRPTASPATMWICLDDDDDDEIEESASIAEEDYGALMRNKTVFASAGAEKMDFGASARSHHDSQRTFVEMGAAAEEQQQQRRSSRKSSPSRRRPAEHNHPIAEILSPTFRPRRRPQQQQQFPSVDQNGHGNKDTKSAAGAPVVRGARVSNGTDAQDNDPRGLFIRLDDNSDEDAGRGSVEENEAPPCKRAHVSASNSLVESPVKPATTAAASPVTASLLDLLNQKYSSSEPLLLDDDDDEGEGEEVNGKLQGRQEAPVERAEDLAALAKAERGSHQQTSQLSITLASDSDDSQVTSPLKPTVKDLFFPKRLDPGLRPCSPLYESIHAYQQHYQQQQQHYQENRKNNTEHSAFFSADEGVSSTAATTADKAKHNKGRQDEEHNTAASNDSPGHRRSLVQPTSRNITGGGGAKASLVPSLPDWGRPADTLLRDFFPTKITKKGFMEAAQKVMSPMHFLDPHDFWEAFSSAEFVGEGSFGLVWRCRTVDGDLVAVKSCPIILRTKANIEDSFSTIREIATMRFLNEMQVPYILPLHSAFYVKATEALPPLAQEALDWRQRLRKKAEAAVLEKEVKLLDRGHAQLSKRGGNASAKGNGRRGGGRAAATTAGTARAHDKPLTFEQQVEAELQRQVAKETCDERARRARLQHVRLPRFLSITEDDLHQSDATAFLVMELCDGDVADIARSDGVAKGVVYCVSSALAAMHELGLLHLDVKPSNVLFAYEHGPSQASSPSPAFAGTAAAPRRIDAVKFYLSDFGNCRLVGPDPLDEVTESYGTFEYMDLRALQDAVCGRPTDAFSLGATLYELLYGKRLYPKCLNPKCADEEDHSRVCFVEAARRTVVLPALPNSGPPNQGSTVSATSATTASVYLPLRTHSTELKSTSKKSPHSTDNNDSKRSMRGLSSASAAMPPLQTLTLALLRKKWSERMTAAECRRYLIDAFHITQADCETENEEE